MAERYGSLSANENITGNLSANESMAGSFGIREIHGGNHCDADGIHADSGNCIQTCDAEHHRQPNPEQLWKNHLERHNINRFVRR